MKTNLILVAIIGVVVAGTGGFFAGTKYQQAKTPVGRFANFRRSGQTNTQGNGQGRFNHSFVY